MVTFHDIGRTLLRCHSIIILILFKEKKTTDRAHFAVVMSSIHAQFRDKRILGVIFASVYLGSLKIQ